MVEWCRVAAAAEIPPNPKSRKSRPKPDVATAADIAAEEVKQEDVTKGETAVEAAANEVKAVAEDSWSAVARAISRPASSAELVVGVPAALAVLLLVVVPPLCRGGGGTVCEWLMAVLTCMGRKKLMKLKKLID